MLICFVAALIFILALIFSMLGLGGAILYVPVLHWLGFDFKAVAIPTALLLNGFTAISAGYVYFRAKMVDIKGSLPMAGTCLVGAPIGAYLTRLVPTETLIVCFSVFVVFVSLRMLFIAGQPDKNAIPRAGIRIPLMAAGGLVIGMIAGLIGVGGGALFVPFMLVLGYSTKTAAATNTFIVIFTSFSGFAGHVATGHFNWPLMAATAVSVVIGAQIGANLMKNKMKSQWIKRMFGLVLLLVAAKLLWSVFMT